MHALVLLVVVLMASGLVAGIPLAALVALRELARLSRVTREPIAGIAQASDERIAVVPFDGSLFFEAAERVLDEIAAIDDVSVVIIRLRQPRSLDATGARVIADIIDALERRGVTAIVKGVQPEHRDLIERVGVTHHLRHPAHLITSLDDAIEHARSHVRREREAGVGGAD